MNVVFFPGKDTPIKRYVSYFPTLVLIETNDNVNNIDNPILCHSKGIIDAIKYCSLIDREITVISMDGVEIDSVPDNVTLVSFRPEHKKCIGDRELCLSEKVKVVYYKSNMNDSHHPYRIKNVRNMILAEINLLG